MKRKLEYIERRKHVYTIDIPDEADLDAEIERVLAHWNEDQIETDSITVTEID